VENVIVPNKQKYITMNTIGETLMHPEFGKLLEILDMNSISLILVTNGLLFLKHAKEMEQYSDVISQLQLSIDGATKETYEKLRRNGKFDILLKNLDWLKGLNERLETKIPIEINAVLSGDNIDELPLFFRVFSKYVLKENIFFWLLNSRMATQSDGNYFHSNRLIENVEPVLKSPCSMPYIKSHILYNGDVGICCRDYHGELLVGNIKEKDFKDIWTGSEYRKVRKLISENRHKDLPLCRNCYVVPDEITLAVNIFIQYQLTVNDDTGLDNISEVLIRFLGDVSDIYNTGNLNESSFKKTLLNYRL
jgi:radical SAM protein with 4Fe4S-binding SPASM domain